MATTTLDLTLELVTCCNCGISFGVPGIVLRERKRDHESFYCPNGHGQHFPGKSDLEKLKEEVAHSATLFFVLVKCPLIAARLRSTASRSSISSLVRSRQYLMSRSYGVCPCCNRTFANLAQHMATKHPEYADTE